MTNPMLRLGAALLAAGLATGLTIGAATPALAADDDLGPPVRVGGDVELKVTVPELVEDGTTGDGAITNAELRWGINAESGRAAYVGCNFLMAGIPGDDGDTGGGRVWTADDEDLYRSTTQDKKVAVMVPKGKGEEPATFEDRCTGTDGKQLSLQSGATSGAELVLTGGTGKRAKGGAVDISWDGSFTVVFYGGLTYWWASDLHLVLNENGNGALTATVGGFAADMDDSTKWVRLKGESVSLADFKGGRLDRDTDGDGDADGGTLQPEYCEVRVDKVSTPQREVAAGETCWGSFPQDFVSFQDRGGQKSYWYSSGGANDRHKKAYPMNVSFNAANSVGPTDRGDDTDDSSGSGSHGTSTGTGTAGAGGTGTGGTGSGLTPNVVPASGSGARSLGAPARVPVPAAGAQPVAFPAVAAATLGLGGDALVPALLGDEATPGERLAYGVTGLALLAAAAIVGFRRRWLVLPFT